MPDGEYKICTKCGESLPLYNFGKRTASPDGLQFACRQCRSLYHQERRQNFPRYVSVTQKLFIERYLGGEVTEPSLRRWMNQGLLAVDRTGDELRVFVDHPTTKKFLRARKNTS